MAVLDYILTVVTVILGAVWIGVGSEMGRDFYKLVWRKRFKRFVSHYQVGHALVKKKVAGASLIKKLRPKDTHGFDSKTNE